MTPPALRGGPSSLAALVLAGSRGPSDPLALSQGVRHRALLEVGGAPMLLRVLRALRATGAVGHITVSIEEPAALASLPELDALVRAGTVAIHRSLPSPSRSVQDVLTGLPPDRSLLVTTADHALLRPEIVLRFLTDAEASGADLAIGLVAAIPAVMAYNYFMRRIRVLRSEMETFEHDYLNIIKRHFLR